MGRIIVFEGLDKSGKATQSKLLVDYLNNRGHASVRVEIPDYSTPIGKEIRASLYNQRDYSPREYQMLMLMNRYEVQGVLLTMLDEYEFLILDRYSLSGLVYGTVDGVDSKWIEAMGSNLLQPDLKFLLDISAKNSISRKREVLSNDRYESDKEFLERVRVEYIRLAKEHNYHVIDALYPTDVIHKGVVSKVVETFGI